MDDKFLIGLYPGKHRVLGVALPRFSFWHLLGLHAIHSPFVSVDGVATLRDLQIALKVCRTRYPDQPRLRANLRDVLVHKLIGNNAAMIRRECEKFVAYIAVHQTIPEFWKNENEIIPKQITAPGILARVANLLAKTRCTHAEIWNDIAPGYACWLSSTIAELEGAELRFTREEDDDEQDDNLPDLNKLTEPELYQVVLDNEGKDFADAWLARRLQHKAEGHE